METVTKKQLLEIYKVSYPTLRKMFMKVPGLEFKKKRIFTKIDLLLIKKYYGLKKNENKNI